MPPVHRFLSAILLVQALSIAASAAKPANIFSDHMVLQRDAKIPIWGSADPGAKVTIRFAEQTIDGVADHNGSWRLELSPMEARAQGLDLVIQAGEQTLTLRDVLVGDVWFAGGQSNMDQKMASSADRLVEAQALVESANLPEIRFRKISDKNSPTPLADLRSDQWSICSPEAVRNFSALGFVFARRLHLELNVPIGIIDCSWGGTPIEPYIPLDAMVEHPTLIALAAMAREADIEGVRNLPGGTYARSEAWLTGAIFNSRVAPVAPYAIRGFIWYQGESNCGKGEDPRDYAHKMQALIRGWRGAWGQAALPFYYVQLPQWNSYAWTYLREEQRLALKNKHTGMVVTVDLDNGNDIHPANKIDVGERLARWPLAQLYSRPIAYSGPLFRSCSLRGANAEISFDHVGEGLMVGTANVGQISEAKDDNLHGFELAGADGTWHAAEANIVEQTIVVSSSNVPHPTAVRYACHPQAAKDAPWNLYNRSGLPASPFCSDWEQMPYDPRLNPAN